MSNEQPIQSEFLTKPADYKVGGSFDYRDIYSLIGWLGVVFVAALIGSMATGSSVETWYADLEKPWFQPPNWIFGPVWTALYVAMAVAAWMIWRRRNDTARKRAIQFFVIVFSIQLILNMCWSILFFGLQSPMFAFFEICVLWVAVAITVFLAFKQNRYSGWLLVPYLGWASFALILNFAIWKANA